MDEHFTLLTDEHIPLLEDIIKEQQEEMYSLTSQDRIYQINNAKTESIEETFPKIAFINNEIKNMCGLNHKWIKKLIEPPKVHQYNKAIHDKQLIKTGSANQENINEILAFYDFDSNIVIKDLNLYNMAFIYAHEYAHHAQNHIIDNACDSIKNISLTKTEKIKPFLNLLFKKFNLTSKCINEGHAMLVEKELVNTLCHKFHDDNFRLNHYDKTIPHLKNAYHFLCNKYGQTYNKSIIDEEEYQNKSYSLEHGIGYAMTTVFNLEPVFYRDMFKPVFTFETKE